MRYSPSCSRFRQHRLVYCTSAAILAVAAARHETVAQDCQPHWLADVFAGISVIATDLLSVGDGPHERLFIADSTNRFIAVLGGTVPVPGTVMNSTPHSFIEFNDGTLDTVYVCGAFTAAVEGPTLNRVARLEGTQWVNMGANLNGTVYAMAEIGGNLYAGGEFFVPQFQGLHYIARWNGTVWEPVQRNLSVFNDMNGAVYALAVYDDGTGPALFAGGEFTLAGGQTVNRIAKWDGTTWSPVGDGFDAPVRSFAVHNSGLGEELYAGGDFTAIGSTPCRHIARWNGVEWQSLGSGVNDTVLTMHSIVLDEGPVLFVGGEFTEADGQAAGWAARWTGSAWLTEGSSLSNSLNGLTYVSAFEDYKGKLYVSGSFLLPPPFSAAGATAIWNGETWQGTSKGFNGQIHGLSLLDWPRGPQLYAAGEFNVAGGVLCDGAARWNGEWWEPVGQGGPKNATSFAVFDDGDGARLYAGCVGTSTLAGLKRLDGETWTDLGFGNTRVSSLAVFDDGTGSALYIGGEFLQVAGQPIAFITKWDGNEFSEVGSQKFDAHVVSLLVYDDGSVPALYAAGGFGNIGSTPAKGIARWRAGQWEPVGQGIFGPQANQGVACLTAFDDGEGMALYAGGRFFQSQGSVGYGLARWRDGQWTILGSGTSGVILGMTGYDDGYGPALYFTGEFTSVGGVAMHNVGRKYGAQWQPLSLGFEVNAKTVLGMEDMHGAGLWAGGQFHTAGGTASHRIAKWQFCPIPEVPFNDSCGSPTTISNGLTSFSTSGATTDGPVDPINCGPEGPASITHDIWFSYVAPCDGIVSLRICPIGFDFRAAVYDSCPSKSEMPLVCTASHCQAAPDLMWTAVAGATYLIRVGGVEGATGGGQIDLRCDPVPANDLCANAVNLVPGTIAFTTLGASTDGPSVSTVCASDGQIHDDVWFRYVSACDGSLTFSVCGSSFDSRLAVYAGCPGLTTFPLWCNNDFCGTASQVTFNTGLGNEYFVRVGGAASAEGSGFLTLSCTPAGQPVNDSCGTNPIISLGSHQVSTIGATSDGLLEPTACSFSGDGQIHRDVWYRFGSNCSSMVTISLCQASFDAKIAVYGNACPVTQGEVVVCSDNGCGLAPSVRFISTGGLRRIRVGGGNSLASGTATMVISCVPIPACPEDTNSDSIVNVQDLLTVIGDWGPCEMCPADVTFNGFVNVEDLLTVIGQWGPCS